MQRARGAGERRRAGHAKIPVSWLPGALLFVLSLLGPPALAAQQRAADSLPRVVGIVIRRQSIFDSTDSGWFARLSNSLHVTTREPLIRRELLFRVGQPYDSARIAESERNLRALGVFRSVEIDSSQTDSGVVMQVTTHDGWTTRPEFSFRSTGGSIVYTIGLFEDNLLGTLTQTAVVYQKNPDRSTTLLQLYRPRLIAGLIAGTFSYASLSDGNLGYAQLALPYFAASSRVGAAITFDDRRQRVLRYRDGAAVPQDTLQDRYLLVRTDFSRAVRASPFGYVRTGLTAQVRRDDYVAEAQYDSTGFGPASVTGAIGGFVEFSRVHQPKVRGFQTLEREEDIDLSTVIRLSLGAAPEALGYSPAHAGLAPAIGVHAGVRFPGGFGFVDAVAGGLYTRTGLDSGQVFVSGTLALLGSGRHLFTLHGEAGVLQNPVPGTEYDLGLGVGPRAFAQHAFTGDHEYFTTAEYRYTVDPELWKVVGLGVAAFVDHGGAWWSGEAPQSGWDFGVGLRLAAVRAPDLSMNRIDLAWRAARPGVPSGWVIAIGRGFAFSTGPRGTAR